MNHITVAHSPDADDIFMYYAIKFGWVGLKNTKFSNISDDIETLNVSAIKGTYDVCAISFALYPHIKNDYALLRTATSFGDGYGPKLVKLKNKRLKTNFTVALSGKYTTNALLFKIKYKHAKIIYMNFLDIQKAVLNGTVDAGVLIHESILNFDEKLEVHCEIWDIWQDLVGFNLPLPLGGMCIRRSIPLLKAINIEKTLTRAVNVAHKNKTLLSNMLLKRDLVRVDYSTLKTYLKLYANENSITLNHLQKSALDALYNLGYQNGFYTLPIKTDDHLIPKEYEGFRFS